MFRKFFIFYLYFVLLFFTGCANSMYKASGYGVVTEEVSSFDGQITFRSSPTWVYHIDRSEYDTRYQFFLGAFWTDKVPEKAFLILTKPGSSNDFTGPAYTSIHGVDINIDGKIQSFKTDTPTNFSNSPYSTYLKSIGTKSTNIIAIPYSYLKEMTQAKSCKLKINTSQGEEVQLFTTEKTVNGVDTAIVSIREMISRIDKFKK